MKKKSKQLKKEERREAVDRLKAYRDKFADLQGFLNAREKTGDRCSKCRQVTGLSLKPKDMATIK